jgi:isoquinoline 1-oxidoreductase beta subunit
MLVGTVLACPVFGGKLKAVNDAPAKALPGVQAVVSLPDAVIVVADGYWNARKGAEALSPEWDLGENATRQEAGNRATLAAALDEPGATARSEGDAAGAVAGAAKQVEAVYLFPFLNHATMEPMNATASVTAEGVEIWAPTQAQGPCQFAVSKALGIKADQVKVNTTFLGGGFGRRFELDFIFHAVFASKAVGAPVKVIWSREEDMRHDFYRPSMAVRLRAGLDGAGAPVGLEAKVAGPSIMSRVFPDMVKNGIDITSVEGFAESPYRFGAVRVDYTRKEIGVPVGFWRSVGNSFSAFAMETFVDELAAAAGQDPVAYRRVLLAAQPRFLAVLNKAADAGGWGKALPSGRARGVAIHLSFGSIVAEVAEVSAQGNALRVHRVTTAVDCGRVINPDTVVAQMESGIVYGLTAAYFGEITIANGRVEQSNFPDYPMLQMRHMPAVDVHIVESGEALGGIGEPATPPIAPAVANALFALTGKRLRALPLKPA